MCVYVLACACVSVSDTVFEVLCKLVEGLALRNTFFGPVAKILLFIRLKQTKD